MRRFAGIVLGLVIVALVSHATKAEPLAGTPLGDFLSGAADGAFWLVFIYSITPANVRCRLLHRRENTRESN